MLIWTFWRPDVVSDELHEDLVAGFRRRTRPNLELETSNGTSMRNKQRNKTRRPTLDGQDGELSALETADHDVISKQNPDEDFSEFPHDPEATSE